MHPSNVTDAARRTFCLRGSHCRLRGAGPNRAICSRGVRYRHRPGIRDIGQGRTTCLSKSRCRQKIPRPGMPWYSRPVLACLGGARSARSTGARPVLACRGLHAGEAPPGALRDEAARASERSGFMSLSPSPQASNVWTVLSSTYVAVACTITGAHPSAMLLRIFQDVLSGHGSNDLAAIAQDVVIALLLRQVPRSAVIWTLH